MGSGPIPDKTVSAQYNKTQVKKSLDLLAVDVLITKLIRRRKEMTGRK